MTSQGAPAHPPINVVNWPSIHRFHHGHDERPIQYEVPGQPFNYLICRPIQYVLQAPLIPSNALVITIGTAHRKCRGLHTRGAIGVLVHRDSRHNISLLMPDGDDQDYWQTGALSAARALDIAVDAAFGRLPDLHHPVRRAVIKTCAGHLVLSATEWILTWRLSGFRNGSGRPIFARDLWMHVDAAAKRLQAHGVRVEFWRVSADETREATCLAEQALEDFCSRLLNDATSAAEPSRSSLAVRAEEGREDVAFDVSDRAPEAFNGPLPEDAASAAQLSRSRAEGPAATEFDVAGRALEAVDSPLPDDAVPPAEPGESSRAAGYGEAEAEGGAGFDIGDRKHSQPLDDPAPAAAVGAGSTAAGVAEVESEGDAELDEGGRGGDLDEDFDLEPFDPYDADFTPDWGFYQEGGAPQM